MNARAATLAILLFTSLCAHAGPGYTITAKKDTIDQRHGESQKLPHGSTRLTTSDICYVFTFKSLSLKEAPEAEAQWVILIESMDGRLHVGTSGHETLPPPATGKPAEIRTDPIQLAEREWQGRKQGGSVEENIYGYAVRVVTTGGVTLASKYSPDKIEQQIDWDHPEKSGDANRPRTPIRPGKAIQP